MGLTWDVQEVAETGSTNADLLAAARSGAPQGRVLVADHQTAGRGRLGRSWVAPPGSALLCSVLVRPSVPVGAVHLVTTALSLAAADACATLAGVHPDLKWPNDLLVGDRKLAGVLAESVVEGDRVAALVIGIGLNVAWPGDVPDEIAGVATSLDRAGAAVDRRALLDAVLDGFGARYDALEGGDLATIVDEARRRTVTIGQRVRVELGGEVLVGDAVDLTTDGHLVVDVDGRRREITVGDVVHLRPHDR